MTFLVIFDTFWKVGFWAFLAIFSVFCKTGHLLIMFHPSFFGINAKKRKNDKNDHFDTFLRPLKKWHFWRFLTKRQKGSFLIRQFRGHFLAILEKWQKCHFWHVQKCAHDTGGTLCDVIFAHLAKQPFLAIWPKWPFLIRQHRGRFWHKCQKRHFELLWIWWFCLELCSRTCHFWHRGDGQKGHPGWLGWGGFGTLFGTLF